MNGSEANTGMDEIMAYEMVYPEIYYRVQPFIMSVCDQMEAYGGEMPSAEVITSIADTIYSDVMTMYPDLMEYVGGAEAQPTITPFFRRSFRRRGLFRDFIEILLLNEIFRRI